MAQHLLACGYRVVAIDLSEAMLQYARENASSWVQSGQASFLQGDAAGFSLQEPVGLAVSTFDALQASFRSVSAALLPAGTFIFDRNTRLGLKRWNAITVEDTEELLLVNRGIYLEESGRAYMRISGFLRLESGLYERFEETAYNTVFDLQAVGSALLEAGFQQAYCARLPDLSAPVAEPEAEGRIFLVARK